MSTMGLRVRAVGGMLFIGEIDRLRSRPGRACFICSMNAGIERWVRRSLRSCRPCPLRSWLHPSP